MQPNILSTASLLFPLVRQALSNVPFHKNSPAHLHTHPAEDEINIILSHNQLRYRVQVGDEEYIIRNNTSIFIPRGIIHSANVLSGSGFFITLRFN